MAAPMTAGLPLGLDLPGGYTVRFTALDPTTGAVVSGVVISAATILTETAAVNTEFGLIDTSAEQADPLWINLVGAAPGG